MHAAEVPVTSPEVEKSQCSNLMKKALLKSK
jgi:hypothetical protein